MEYTILNENINGDTVKQLSQQELLVLCDEIRHFLIQSVSKTGGHLSSNLGTVELTVAMFKVFDFAQDTVVWDVGHQSYTYKLLTGRMAAFDTLRKGGGISGFPAPSECDKDAFIAGHGSTSISAAVGIASAKKRLGEPGYVIAVIGDGALTGGMAYEGLNNISPELDNLIVILNDNKMSISKNVGGMARYLTKLRNEPRYSSVKKNTEDLLLKLPLIGRPLWRFLIRVKTFLRRAVYNSTFFEDMDLQYIGKIAGDDVQGLSQLLSNVSKRKGPMLLHVETTKGKGYAPAENNPGAFHGVSTFDSENLTDPDMAPSKSFSVEFGKALTEIARQNDKVCAITAAMKYGTGLQYFYKEHKDRFFDVGMAEEHAITFSAGLASKGFLPVLAIYSTFLQRGYDQLIHDILLQNKDIILAIDRAGLVPGDGETHQGIYDVAMLSQFDGFKVVSPCNYNELYYWLNELISNASGPRALRYPRGSEDAALAHLPCTGRDYDKIITSEKAGVAMVSYGRLCSQVLSACELAKGEGKQVDAYKLTVLHPLPTNLADELMQYERIVFAEDGIVQGGIGQQLGYALFQRGYKGAYEVKGVTGHNVDHASVEQLYNNYGLDAQSLATLL